VTVDSEDDADGDEDRRCKEGREALSRAVALAVDACRRPKPVHGRCVIKDSPPLIFSKFWAQGEDADSDDSDDEAVAEMKSPSTPEFIAEALDAGFSVDQLARAEAALASSNDQSTDRLLPISIVTKLVQRNLAGAPWQGPLPYPRVSPPRTLGDCIANARFLNASSRGALAAFRRSSAPAGRFVGG
jgi:hypothetical protein